MTIKQVKDNQLQADVLVIGGGPAGTWAALTAAKAGAKVILADKGYCGSSGATAASGTGVLYVPPDPAQRQEAIIGREKMAGYLADSAWSNRVLEQTYLNMNLLEKLGYPFPVDEFGEIFRGSLSGPEYMRLMRKLVKKAGVTIWDHSPALELQSDNHGVSGSIGLHTITGESWNVQANAVVIASGGCAFLSKSLGCNVLTGDGYLMAAEAGAEMSGIEFSNAYSISPAFASVTKSAFYTWATFYYQDGTVIEGAGGKYGRSVIAKTLIDQPVYGRLDKTTEDMQQWMRKAQPNFFLPFNRKGINPFTDLFPVTLRLEGTVRGTGGIRIVDETCATTVPGLYAAGDAATRELLCGAFTGGGSHNSAWAISSGHWSGEAAAKHALALSQSSTSRQSTGLSVTPFRTDDNAASGSIVQELIKSVQAEVYPYERNWFRSEVKLKQSLVQLDQAWNELRSGITLPNDPNLRFKAREAAAMIATARWMYTAGLARTETRGMHRRDDFPKIDPNQQYRLITGGIDKIYTRAEHLPSNKEAIFS